MIVALELIGLVCLVVAGWLVSPPLAFAVLGVAAFASAYGLARSATKGDK